MIVVSWFSGSRRRINDTLTVKQYFSVSFTCFIRKKMWMRNLCGGGAAKKSNVDNKLIK
jgi:hypothetical protein